MKRLALLAAIVVVAIRAVYAVPYTPLVNHGDSRNRVDLVILGDGYTSTDLGNGLLTRDARWAMEEIFGKEPYKEYEPYFNVWRVDVESAESGADHSGLGVFRATALDAAYDCPGPQDMCVTPDKVFNAIASTGLSPDIVLVIVNDPQPGYTPAPKGYFGKPLYVTSNNYDNLRQVLDDSPDTIVKRIYSFMRPVDRIFFPSNYITAGQRLLMPRLQIVKPATHALTVEWTVDGVPVSSDGSTLDTSRILPGVRTLSGLVYDPTPFVTTDPDGLLRQTVSATLTVAARGAYTVTPNDFDGDGRSELAVFDRRAGGFLLEGGQRLDWGRRGDIPVPADYDGDRRMDLAVYRPWAGTWYIPGRAPIQLGQPGDMPMPMDAGAAQLGPVTGRAEPVVYRLFAGNVYGFFYSVLYGQQTFAHRGAVPLLPWNQGGFKTGAWYPWQGVFVPDLPTSSFLGLPGDIPVPSNFMGDQTTEYAVFRPSTGVWYISDFFKRSDPVLQYRWGAAGDIPVLLDRDGDGRAELGVFRPATAVWYFWNLTTNQTETRQLGATGDVPLGAPAGWWRARTTGDGDGDRRADLAVFRPSSGQWRIHRSSGTRTPFVCMSWVCTNNPAFAKSTVVDWGLPTDVPVSGDYDGDNRLDPAVFRPSDGTWWILYSAREFADSATVAWGLNGDTVVPADYDADGRDDVAVYRPSTGRWYVRLSAGGLLVRDWGLPGDEPAPADYDGDGRADLAVFRPSTGLWYILDRFSNTYETRDWGVAGDIPVQADYDGDLRADEAVFRPSEGRWYIRLSATKQYAIHDFGVAGDTPQPADYDGDGRADVAVFRPSTGRWYILDVATIDWGAPGDVPVTRIR